MASIAVGGGHGGKKSVDSEIPLVPFIDLLLCCVMFLLVTAVWNQLAQLEVNQRVPGPTTPTEPVDTPEVVELAIENAYRNDVAVVFAAGNGNEAIAGDGYASHPCVVTVAASTDCNTRAYYSDYGDTVWVCAPSSGGRCGVVTTDMQEGGENPFGSYSSGFGGTSSAAPLVSGVIALMQSAFVQRHGPGHRLSVEQAKASWAAYGGDKSQISAACKTSNDAFAAQAAAMKC